MLQLLVLASAAHAVDFNGSFSLFATATDNRGVETDLVEQRYSLNLFQRFTPYLSLRAGYQYFDFDSQAEVGDFSRRNREPRLDLRYARAKLSGLLSLRRRLAEGSEQGDDFELTSLLANLAWRPSRGPGFSVSYRDETNVAEEALFGRDAVSESITVETFYRRELWSLSYVYRHAEVENEVAQFRSEQDRHDLRARAGRSFFGDRLTLGFSSIVGRLERRAEGAAALDPAVPLTANQGLFAVDLSPEIGELAPAPTLVDGDTRTPAEPPIDIGGANTFRNLGLDLGLTQPVSRLEVGVDRPSGRGVLWQVYRSRDNLIWERIPFVAAQFDEARLRYILRFTTVEDRFFKAVNVSANSEPTVLVTELRALLDIEQVGEGASESTLYRANLSADFRPSERISASVALGTTNEEEIGGGFVRRDFEATYASARLLVDLGRELDLSLGYQFSDSETLREPVLLRAQETLNLGLVWTPLPTLVAGLTVQHRDESERGTLLQSTDSVQLSVAMQLLPDLRLITEVEGARQDDPFAGFARNTRSWRQTLEARPTRRWAVSGRFSYTEFDTDRDTALRERRDFQLRSDWNATAYLNLIGSWSWSRNDGQTALNQAYNLSYAPGPKLSLSANYREFESDGVRSTSSGSASLTYRLTPNLRLFGSLSRSSFGQETGPDTDITSLRTGVNAFF